MASMTLNLVGCISKELVTIPIQKLADTRIKTKQRKKERNKIKKKKKIKKSEH